MPGRLAYDEAMRFSKVRLQIPDPELKEGQVETVTIHTNAGSLQNPWGIEGGFAIVYKFRTRSGQFRALRCFHVPMKPDTQFRYERIGAYFKTHARDITTNFTYHNQGILVKEQGQPAGKVYPLIEMDWIDGVTLIERVDDLCRRRDRAALQHLCTQWLHLVQILQTAHIAHGDLAGTNVMVRPDGRLVLVDYDGVYIPEFSGLPQILSGQADYQHPQMMLRPFNEHLDAFSALVIYTVLLALAAQPELWEQYTRRDAQNKPIDTNLLLTEEDFRQPYQSPLLNQLAQSPDQQVRQLVQELRHACSLPVAQVRFPSYLIDADYEKKQALARLVSALQSDDDEQIAAAWQPLLATYPPAQVHQPRCQLATQRLAALQRFRTAIQQQCHLAQIIAAYDPILDPCKNVTQQERELLTHARHFLAACQQNDDEAILAAAENIQRQHGLSFFSRADQQRIELLNEHRRKWHQFTEALHTAAQKAQEHGPQCILTAYDALPQTLHARLTESQRMYVERARTALHLLHQVRQDEDPASLLAAHEQAPVQAFPHLFSIQDQRRIESALKLREISQARREANYAQTLRLAREISTPAWLNSQKPSLIMAMRRVMRTAWLEAVSIYILEHPGSNQLTVSWQWPQEDLIQHAFIFWHPDTPPRVPRQAYGSTLEQIAFYKVAERSDRSNTGQATIPIGTYQRTYIAVCAAMCDAIWDREVEVETWYFAPAIEQVVQVNHTIATMTYKAHI